MPELAEVQIMSDYINHVVRNKKFVDVARSKVSKVKTDLTTEFDEFKIKAETRGKELRLRLYNGRVSKYLLCSMGMSGQWRFDALMNKQKHDHLAFICKDGGALFLNDVRRFAKWKWADTENGWSKNRGPCPVKEHEEFVKNIHLNLKRKVFQNRLICEIMLNQQYFNGIGNYLRAEILYRMNINPFETAYTVLTSSKVDDFLIQCKTVPIESYYVGGGEIKDWENPMKRGYGRGRINEKMKTEVTFPSFRDWLQCYNKPNMLSTVDNTKRRIWYSEKQISNDS